MRESMQPLKSPSIFRQHFDQQGFVVLKSQVPEELLHRGMQVINAHLQPLVAPAEFEADVGYPGAPASRDEQGGQTPRRLLHAYARDEIFAKLASLPGVVSPLEDLLQGPIALSQCHHNCVMTKFPGYSSATLWHQDIRYWSFDRPELISAWFALGAENRRNGALRVIPGSHLIELDRGRLDGELFLRPELEENRALIHQAIDVALNPGDVLLFDCKLFHAAGKNRSSTVKLSPVFTYHREDNRPIPATRSAKWPSISMDRLDAAKNE